MTPRDHDRAVELISTRGVEGIGSADEAWLEAHLAECRQCAAYADWLRSAAQMLRAMPVMASPRLVSTTQARLRARALEMQERETRSFLIAVSFCLGVLVSTGSAWVWWKFGSWVAEAVGLPQSIVAPGVLLFWLLPALAVALLMIAVPKSVFNHPLMLALTREREGEVR